LSKGRGKNKKEELAPLFAGYSLGVLTSPFYKEPALSVVEGEIREGFCIEQ
jgi:hypothetical protein